MANRCATWNTTPTVRAQQMTCSIFRRAAGAASSGRAIRSRRGVRGIDVLLGTTGSGGNGRRPAAPSPRRARPARRSRRSASSPGRRRSPGLTSAQIDFGLDDVVRDDGARRPDGAELPHAAARHEAVDDVPLPDHRFGRAAAAARATTTRSRRARRRTALPPADGHHEQQGGALPRLHRHRPVRDRRAGAPAFILDATARYVWWYNDGSDACGAAHELRRQVHVDRQRQRAGRHATRTTRTG